MSSFLPLSTFYMEMSALALSSPTSPFGKGGWRGIRAFAVPAIRRESSPAPLWERGEQGADQLHLADKQSPRTPI